LNPPRPELSVVIPVLNEEKALALLHPRLESVLKGLGRTHEVIYVDDGSTDGTLDLLKDLQARAPSTVRIVELFRNYGQFTAIIAGFEHCRGDIVVTLDADLQNPPEEIPRLLAKIEEGYDVVNGWRADRRDGGFRRLVSRFANRIGARATGLEVRDYGCMLRAYRREIVRQVLQCREHSPYIPTIANSFARRVAEIPVAHAGRGAGRSKYSLSRLIALQFDMLATFSVRPMRALAYLGLAISGLGAGLGVVLLTRRLVLGPRHDEALALFAALSFLQGLLFLALGLVAEQVGRIYDIVRRKPRYVVRRVHEGPAGETAETLVGRADGAAGLRDDGVSSRHAGN
jgi:undecaprenyl-phosphate 4-deoxy-4-formamido-L-arabinose transferase